jgi:hypothetical protein
MKKFKKLGFGFKEFLKAELEENPKDCEAENTEQISHSPHLDKFNSTDNCSPVESKESFGVEDVRDGQILPVIIKNPFEVTLSEEDQVLIASMPRSQSPSYSQPQHRLFYHHSSSPLNFLCEVCFSFFYFIL